MIHPLSSRSTSSRGILPLSQYSCVFFYVGCTGLLFCYAFCEPTTCAACSLLPFCLFTPMFEHSYFQCLTPQHLKHFTFSTLFCYLTSTSSFTPHCITPVANISYLFWGFSLFFLSSSFFVLQLQARCPNFLQLQYSLFLLPSNCILSEVRAHFSLSMLLRRLLYCC